jgi:DNA polymerase-3 subunit delta'
MAKEAPPPLQIGVAADGRLPLPWLGDTLAASAALAGAHALLIHGPAGAGHLEFSLLLAQASLCEAPGAARSGRPCGRCAGCHLVLQRSHPDLRLVLPAALRAQMAWTEDEDYIPPKGEAKPSREIRVEQIRMAIDWAQQTSGRGRGKVLVLHPADAMNGPAANALLKTLEEPPGAMRLLLTSADPERLLPTVRSRCQRLPLVLPPTAQAESWLREQGLAEPAALLALAGGSPLEALAWAREGVGPALLAELPRRVAAGDASPLAGRAIPRVVELLLKLAHDAQVTAAGGAPRFFAAAHLPSGADPAALRTWQQALLRAARHDEHPWNAGLLIESLVTQAAAVWPRPAAPVASRGGASLNSRP